tara:strand:- start:541756 stop:542211 length:456 start_codon:yes stop_codon:yes gene_type:complete
MSNLSRSVVTETSYLTLHYRLAVQNGDDIVSTFDENPATLQLGSNQLASFLEACLIGLHEDEHQVFTLSAEQAFGPRNPDMFQRVSRITLDNNSMDGAEYKIGDVVEFASPEGGQFAGVLREVDDESAVFDFNHPLAGKDLQFEVKIIGIL